jgi:hypothetical protein
MKIWQIAVGDTFTYQGKQYTKVTRLNAEDDKGNIVQFHIEAEVAKGQL